MRVRCLLLILLLPVLSFARGSLSGYCTQGGQKIVTNGIPSTTKAMVSYPQCSNTVTYTGGPSGTVTTVGTAVTLVTGTNFNSNGGWAGLSITINSVSYTVLTCASATSCTLTGSAGTQASPVAYTMASTAPAPIFTSNGSPLANPFTATLQGYWQFFAANGAYDVTLSGGGFPAPVTWGAQGLIDPILPATFVISFNTRTGAVTLTTSDITAALGQLLSPFGGPTFDSLTLTTFLHAATAAISGAATIGTNATVGGNLIVVGNTDLTGALTTTKSMTATTAGSGDVVTITMGGSSGSAGKYAQTTSAGTPTVVLTNGGTDPALSTGRAWEQTVNFIATENGANNAIACASASGPVLVSGLVVTVQLAHTLQAGTNTFAYNGGTALGIKSHFNSANNIATAYAATGSITIRYNGTLWLDLSQ